MTIRLPDDPITRESLAAVLPRLIERFSPSRIILFGSRVRGDAREDSDFDLIVVSEAFRGIRFPERMGLALKSFEFPLHVDCICYTPEEFEIARRSSFIVREALEHGFERTLDAA